MGNAKKRYPTLFDEFLRVNSVDFKQLRSAVDMGRSQLTKYRAGEEPLAFNVAKLVRAASTLLHRDVKAREMFDVGENEPVSAVVRKPPNLKGIYKSVYDTNLDSLMRKYGLPPAWLATQLGVSRQSLLRVRSGKMSPSVFSIRTIVSGLRKMGYPVYARDVADVGEAQLPDKRLQSAPPVH